jgi:hypothetical protein
MMLISAVNICIEIKQGNILKCWPYVFDILLANGCHLFEVDGVTAVSGLLLLHTTPLTHVLLSSRVRGGVAAGCWPAVAADAVAALLHLVVFALAL